MSESNDGIISDLLLGLRILESNNRDFESIIELLTQ